MTAYESNTTLDAIARRIREADHIALLSHSKPDGDALGSLLALHRGLEQLGTTVTTYVMGPLEPNLFSLVGETPVQRVEDAPPGDDHDLIVIVDTGNWSQLEPVADWLAGRADDTICVDHHGQGDPDVAAMRYVDTAAPAATVLVTRLLDELGVELTGGRNGIAEPLFLGLATDTGWFRHGQSEAETFRLAARLLECGVDKIRLYQLVEETHRPQRLAMLGQALKSLEYHNDGEVAVMALAPEDFTLTGGVLEELTGLVNVPLSVDIVRLSILLTQTEPGRTKISFRSKADVDGRGAEAETSRSRRPRTPKASEIAAYFGGGGHTHAAGARVDMDLHAARHAVREALGSVPTKTWQPPDDANAEASDDASPAAPTRGASG